MNKLDIVVKACEDKLGKDISVIDISKKSNFADYFVIVTGNTNQHIKAISEEIEFKLKKEGFDVLSNEGIRNDSWLLMDLGDIIVHLFTEDQRDFYSIEKLWD